MEESTIQQPPQSRPYGLPMSPKPHLFGDAPPKTERVLISDVLTPDDYRRWRWNSTKRAIFGSIGGGLLTAFLVRRFYPRKLNTNSVILAGFTGGIVTSVYSTSSYIKGELARARAMAESMSIPKTGEGEAIFTDPTMTNVDTPKYVEPKFTEVPKPSVVEEQDKWKSLGEGKQGEMRDPFFRPGVPRRDA